MEWNFGDPASGTANTSSLRIPKHRFTVPGTYQVTLKVIFCGRTLTYSKNVQVQPAPVVDLGSDRIICSNAPLILDAGNGNDYSWSTGATTRNITVNTTGSYWVSVSNGYCTSSDTLQVSVLTQPIVDLGRDTMLCERPNLMLNAANTGCSYLWSTGVTTQTFFVSQPGSYWVAVNNGQCTDYDTIQVDYTGVSGLTASASKYQVPYREPVTFWATANQAVSWQWDFGDEQQAFTAQAEHVYRQEGTYQAVVTVGE